MSDPRGPGFVRGTPKRGERAQATGDVAPSEARSSARRLLNLPARYEQVCRVKLYGGDVGITVLDNAQAAEAHVETRAWMKSHGLPEDPQPGSNAWLEFAHQLAAHLLSKALVDPTSGAPLWDSCEDMCHDLTREDCEFLEEKRQEHQRTTCPRFDDLTPAQFSEVLDALVEGREDPKVRWRDFPRSMLLDSLLTLAGRLRACTGSTSSDTTKHGSGGSA